MVTPLNTFAKYNRFFVSPEIEHDKFTYKFKNFYMFICNGTKNNEPIYSEYHVSIITYTDGSNNQIITNWKGQFEVGSDLIKYWEDHYQELDRTIENFLITAYNNVEMQKMMNDNFIKQTNNYTLDKFKNK